MVRSSFTFKTQPYLLSHVSTAKQYKIVLKGFVHIISSDSLYWHAWFTTVPFIALLYKIWTRYPCRPFQVAGVYQLTGAMSFVLHIICPRNHFSYTSFVLEIICLTHHLSYRVGKTSFVLHIMHLSYTSFVLQRGDTIVCSTLRLYSSLQLSYGERETSFVLQLSYRNTMIFLKWITSFVL